MPPPAFHCRITGAGNNESYVGGGESLCSSGAASDGAGGADDKISTSSGRDSPEGAMEVLLALLEVVGLLRRLDLRGGGCLRWAAVADRLPLPHLQ